MPDPLLDDLEDDAPPRQAVPKSTIAALVVVFVLGGGFLAGILLFSGKPPKPLPPPQEDVEPTQMEGALLSASGSIIGDLLRRGERALKQGRLVEPPGANVRDFINEINKLAPGNALAKEMEQRGHARLTTLGNAAFERQDWALAEQLYTQLVRFAPSDVRAVDRLAEVKKYAAGAPPPPPAPPGPEAPPGAPPPTK